MHDDFIMFTNDNQNDYMYQNEFLFKKCKNMEK